MCNCFTATVVNKIIFITPQVLLIIRQFTFHASFLINICAKIGIDWTSAL